MKKNLLAVAVAASAAGMASVATAQMYINTEHTGEALVFPFYSAQNGNTTNIHIVNTTSQFKAVKVKMVEGYESLETRDFNLYLSPQDHFSFAIMADGD
ncbi:MAG: cell surface protein, partial [Halieaceae bacterium]